jgi:hypothetical protein
MAVWVLAFLTFPSYATTLQYILLNKALGCTGDVNCWNFEDPTTMTPDSMLNVTNTFGPYSSSTRRLGLSTQISVLAPSTSRWTAFLANMLKVSQQTKVGCAQSQIN